MYQLNYKLLYCIIYQENFKLLHENIKMFSEFSLCAELQRSKATTPLKGLRNIKSTLLCNKFVQKR